MCSGTVFVADADTKADDIVHLDIEICQRIKSLVIDADGIVISSDRYCGALGPGMLDNIEQQLPDRPGMPGPPGRRPPRRGTPARRDDRAKGRPAQPGYTDKEL